MLSKVKALFLTVSMILFSAVLSVPSHAAVTSGISARSTELSQGDFVYIDIIVPAMTQNADCADFSVTFDSTAFEVYSWYSNISTDANYIGNFVTGAMVGTGNNNFSLHAANSGNTSADKIDLSSGLTLTASLRVKDTAKNGIYTLTLGGNDSSDSPSFSYVREGTSDNYVELWNPSTTIATVNISGSTADPDAGLPIQGGGLTLSSAQVNRGDTFIAYITIPAIAIKADTALIRVSFDQSAFEVISWSADSSISTPAVGTNYFSMRAENLDLKKGMTLAATLRAKLGAYYGNYGLNLTHSIIGTNNGQVKELWNPTYTYKSINIGTGSTNYTTGSGGGVSLSRSEVNAGDTFTAYVTIPPISGSADAASILVEFDQNAFEVISWIPYVYGMSPNYGAGYFNLTASNNSRNIDLSSGITLGATMRAKSSAPSGGYYFRLTTGSFTYMSDSGYYRQQLWYPTNTYAYIRIVQGGSTSSGSWNTDPWRTPILTTTSTARTTAAVTTSLIRTTASTTVTTTQYNDTTRPLPSDTEIIRDDPDDPDDEDEDEEYLNNDDDSLYDEPDDIIEPDDFEEPDEDDDNDEDDDYIVPDNNNSLIVEEDEDDIWFGDDDTDDDISVGGDDTNPTYSRLISLSADLSGLEQGDIRISTKKKYFNGDTRIILKNTDEADKAAASAVRSLGLAGTSYYAFDMSVYDEDADRYISRFISGGIDVYLPIPKNLSGRTSSLGVYHIGSSGTERIRSDIVNDGGVRKIHFSASSFSPYMIVDTAGAKDAELVTPGGSGTTTRPTYTFNGNVNPATGVAAAIILPAAMTGCIFLARKNTKHRKRAKQKGIDEDGR